MKNHKYAVHREKKRSVTCEICGKSFYTMFHLQKHLLSHTDKSERLTERTQCEYCGEWLMSKSGIYYHEQIHTSGVQKCPQCQMELPNKASLLGHIRSHHRERKFKCGYCEKTFSNASTMKVHFFFFKFLSMKAFYPEHIFPNISRPTKRVTPDTKYINVNFAQKLLQYKVHDEHIQGEIIQKKYRKNEKPNHIQILSSKL